QDHLLYSILGLNSKKCYLVEDGLLDYQRKKINKKINKIYLTGLASIPKELSHKVELINLKELWNKKTLKEQSEILDIFLFDLNIKEKIKGRDIVLFTQPLSEDNVITEEEKIEIYSKIAKKYPKNRLIIKIHPREKTNYKNIFKEYLVLDNPFPFEILNLLDVKFNKAITLFSTAALGLGKGVEVDFYGTEVHDKILERFGSCDNIMERNCFLKEEQ
ncbi:glycosyltransferase family 52, partial [Cetobacterium sp.]|uniref:glycosyltransferase family 52 n=1 Tax=Cetobacterium sp. TaxID=2071632 RepID=UPI003F3BD1CE